MTERRYCTTCQTTRNAEGGYKKVGSTRGWRCAICIARKSASPYASTKTMEKLCPQQNAK